MYVPVPLPCSTFHAPSIRCRRSQCLREAVCTPLRRDSRRTLDTSLYQPLFPLILSCITRCAYSVVEAQPEEEHLELVTVPQFMVGCQPYSSEEFCLPQIRQEMFERSEDAAAAPATSPASMAPLAPRPASTTSPGGVATTSAGTQCDRNPATIGWRDKN